MRRVYRTRVDWWLAVIIVLAMGVSLASSLAAIAAGTPGARSPAVLGLVVGFALPGWIVLSTRYTLGDDHLEVRSGPFRWRIPIADITAIEPTSNPLSSPALSLRRLRIAYGNGRAVMISPRDEQGFLRELQALRGGRRRVG